MKNVGRVLATVGLVLLLVTSVVCGCGGGGEKEAKTVVLGWMGDQTGPSASIFRQVIMAMNDYLEDMEDTNPITGVDVEIIAYDTRMETARIPVGYQWLKGQGMDLLLGWDAMTPAITRADQAVDRTPQYNFTAWPTTMDEDWVYSFGYTNQIEGRAILDYVINQWWPAKNAGRAVKVGWVANPEQGTYGEFGAGFEYVLARNPGKAEMIKTGGAATQSAWASETAIVKDCDVIIVTTVGTSSGTFLNEIIQRGYKGQIVASTNAVLGAWDMVTSLVPKSSLNGMLIPHFYPLWVDQTQFIEKADQVLSAKHPAEAAKLKAGTTWISGWLTAHILCEAVREAAAEIGAQNVDGAAIRDAFETMDLEIEGMPNITLAGHGAHNVFQPNCRMIQYDAAKDDFYAITGWFVAPRFVE